MQLKLKEKLIMRTRILAATTVATAVISGIAFAQTPKAEEDHSAHHPAGSTAAANSSTETVLIVSSSFPAFFQA